MKRRLIRAKEAGRVGLKKDPVTDISTVQRTSSTLYRHVLYSEQFSFLSHLILYLALALRDKIDSKQKITMWSQSGEHYILLYYTIIYSQMTQKSSPMPRRIQPRNKKSVKSRNLTTTTDSVQSNHV